MKKNKIILKPGFHRNHEVVFFAFKFDDALLKVLKKLNTAMMWSNSNKYWYVAKKDFYLNKFYESVKPYAYVDYTAFSKKTPAIVVKKPIKVNLKELLNDEQKLVLNNFYKYLRGKRFSESTLKTYTYLVAEFLLHTSDDKVLSIRAIEKHAETVLIWKNVSISTHRQFISAMKHYLVFTNADLVIDFTALAPKKDKKLPNVLANSEVVELIRVTKNLKHRVCISLIYSSGLRIGELINLKLYDLDLHRNVLKISKGKGRKDRYVPIASVILPMLNNYITTYEPKTYLIEGLVKGVQYSPLSIRKFLAKSCALAGIIKKVTPHTLRHSYATHLLENGTDIRYIQELLGHTRPETTMLYTHVRSQDLQKINNPLDLYVKQLEQRKKNS